MQIIKKYGGDVLFVLVLISFFFAYTTIWQEKVWQVANIDVLWTIVITMLCLMGVWLILRTLKLEKWILLVIPLMILVRGEWMALTGLIVWLLANQAVGLKIKSLFNQKENTVFQSILAQFLGMVANGYLVWIMMHLPVNYNFVYYGVFLVEILILNSILSNWIGTQINNFKNNQWDWQTRIVVLFTIIFLVYSLTSYYNWDDLAKHLFIAKQVWLQGIFNFDPRYVVGLDTSIVSQNSYVAGYLLGGEILDRLINLSMFVMGWLVLASWWKNNFGKSSILGILFLILTPLFLWQIDICFIDSFNFLGTSLILIVFWSLINKIEAKNLWLFGALIGANFITKQQSIFMIIPAVMLLLLIILIKERKHLKNLALALFVSLVLILPVVGKNYWLTGNPFYPYMNGLIKSDFLPDENIGEQWKQDFIPADFVYDITFHGQKYVENHNFGFGFIFVVLIWFVPLILIDQKKWRNLLLIISFVFGFLIWFFISGPYMRYFIALMPLGMTLMVMTMAKITEFLNKYSRVVFTILLAPILAINFTAMSGITNMIPIYPIKNIWYHDLKFNNYTDLEKAFAKADEVFDHDNKGLLVESPALYLANSKMESMYWYHWKNYEEIAMSGKKDKELEKLIFEDKGFDYIVIPNTDRYGLFTDSFLSELKQNYKGEIFSVYSQNK